MRIIFIVSALALIVWSGVAYGQTDLQPTNSAPNPYSTVANWAKMPEGRVWGSTSAVEVDRDGVSIWVGERCGQNSCLDRTKNEMSNLSSILKFDASGKLVKTFTGSAEEENRTTHRSRRLQEHQQRAGASRIAAWGPHPSQPGVTRYTNSVPTENC